jgi:hypothetical protein
LSKGRLGSKTGVGKGWCRGSAAGLSTFALGARVWSVMLGLRRYVFIDAFGFEDRRSVPLSGGTPQPSMTSNRRPAGQADGSGNLSATVAADRAFPAAVAELGR